MPVVKYRKKISSVGSVIELYRGDWDKVLPHPKGVLIERGNQLVLNGTVLYQGEWDQYWSHSQGALVRRDDTFFLVTMPKASSQRAV